MDDVACRVAAEFDLGTPIEHVRLAGGPQGVTKLTTTRGTFVLKHVHRPREVGLQARVAAALNASGIRQARPATSVRGSYVSSCGRSVQEFLPGRICLSPGPEQALAVMAHLARHDAALARLAIPAWLGRDDTIWDRVASPGYLLQQLPGLLSRRGPADADHAAVSVALGYLDAALPRILALPRQLVHGDVGPDNVLMDGGDVAAIIDFTPWREPALFSLSTALYWYHVHGHGDGADAGAIRASVTAYARRRPLGSEELAVWPDLLLREALRRLATPLAIADSAGGSTPAHLHTRHQAVVALIRSWEELRR